jgi:hypothetical protein
VRSRFAGTRRVFWRNLNGEPSAKGARVRRREFIAMLGSAAALPLAARAQHAAKMPRIGIIDDAPMWRSFRQALRELGYVEGQTIAYLWRWRSGPARKRRG